MNIPLSQHIVITIIIKTPSTTDKNREAEILRSLGLQDKVPPFDPSTAHMHDFADKPSQDARGGNGDDEVFGDEPEEEGPFCAGKAMMSQPGFVPGIGDDDGGDDDL